MPLAVDTMPENHKIVKSAVYDEFAFYLLVY
jgi:hypothetical protein